MDFQFKSLNLWSKVVSVIGAMAVGDFVWAKYISSIATIQPIVAANWSVLVVFLGAYVVVSYVEDRRMIIPAAIGAWIGTYYGI